MINENLEKIDTWYEMVKGEKELSIQEAKQINNQIKEDPTNKQQLKEKLIIGTLHAIRDFVKNINFVELLDGVYDIDDFISVCCEVWIEEIEENLDKKRSFSKMFDSDFFDKLNSKLGIEQEKLIYEYVKGCERGLDMTPKQFDSIFYDFFKIKNEKDEVTYEQFLEILEKYIYLNWKDIYGGEKKNIYNMLTKCYELYDYYGNSNIAFSKKYIIFLRSLFLEKVINEYQNTEQIGYTMNLCERVDRDNLKRTLEIAISELTPEEQFIIKERFGFNDEDNNIKTLEEIADKMDETWGKAKVRKSESYAIRKLRCKRNMFIDYV